MSFEEIRYKGKPVKRDKGFSTNSTQVIVMQKNNPNRLDMRFKCNKEWVKSYKPISIKSDPNAPPGMLYFLNDDRSIN